MEWHPEKDERTVQYHRMYSVVRHGAGREVERGKERKVRKAPGRQREAFSMRWY